MSVIQAIEKAELNIQMTYGGDIKKDILNKLYEIRQAAYKELHTSTERVITLCGSTKFYEVFKLAGLKLTLNDWLVYSIGIDTKSDEDIKAAGDFKIDHERLDRLHKKKIDKSGAIMVIDVDNYVGHSTQSEINYARLTQKEIYSYSKTTDFAKLAKFGV